MRLWPSPSRFPDGTLGPEYGPRSVSTYQRHLTRHKDWAYRPPRKEREDFRLLREFMTMADGSVRQDGISDRQLFVYLEVVVGGSSIKGLARRCQVRRETIKTYLRRLQAKAIQARAEGGHCG